MHVVLWNNDKNLSMSVRLTCTRQTSNAQCPELRADQRAKWWSSTGRNPVPWRKTSRSSAVGRPVDCAANKPWRKQMGDTWIGTPLSEQADPTCARCRPQPQLLFGVHDPNYQLGVDSLLLGSSGCLIRFWLWSFSGWIMVCIHKAWFPIIRRRWSSSSLAAM